MLVPLLAQATFDNAGQQFLGFISKVLILLGIAVVCYGGWMVSQGKTAEGVTAVVEGGPVVRPGCLTANGREWTRIDGNLLNVVTRLGEGRDQTRQNSIVLGASGVGKSLVLNKLARHIARLYEDHAQDRLRSWSAEQREALVRHALVLHENSTWNWPRKTRRSAGGCRPCSRRGAAGATAGCCSTGSPMLFNTGSREDIERLGRDLGLSRLAQEAIARFPRPDQQTGPKYSEFLYYHTDAQQPICGPVRYFRLPEPELSFTQTPLNP